VRQAQVLARQVISPASPTDLGIINRGTFRYYLTRTGRTAIAAACHFTQNTIIPALA
jgi:hypothetical protein